MRPPNSVGGLEGIQAQIRDLEASKRASAERVSAMTVAHGTLQDMLQEMEEKTSQLDSLHEEIGTLEEAKSRLEVWVDEFRDTKTKELHTEFDELRLDLQQDIQKLRETRAAEQMAIKEIIAAQELNDKALRRRMDVATNQMASNAKKQEFLRGEIVRLNEWARKLGIRDQEYNQASANLSAREERFAKVKRDYEADMAEVRSEALRLKSLARSSTAVQQSSDASAKVMHEESARLSAEKHAARNSLTQVQAELAKAEKELQACTAASTALLRREQAVIAAERRLNLKG